MSRPRNPDNDRHKVTFRLPGDLLDRLDAAAEERVLGRSKLVEILLERGLGLLDDTP